MNSNGTETTGTHATETPASTTGTSTHTSTAAVTTPEQLTLLNTPSVPLQFRLDERTRRAGLQHVAELRALMAEQAAGRRNVGGRRAQRADRDRQNQAA